MNDDYRVLLSCRVPDHLVEAVEAAARRTLISNSDFVRGAILGVAEGRRCDQARVSIVMKQAGFTLTLVDSELAELGVYRGGCRACQNLSRRAFWISEHADDLLRARRARSHKG